MRRLLATAIFLLLPASFGGDASADAEIILDNTRASFIGTWSTGTASTDKYGADYRYVTISTSGGKAVIYMPVIPQTSADWEVYAWYPQGSNRTAEAQYFIQHTGGCATVYLNQQTNGGTWNYLGTYAMNAGTSCFVQITNSASDTSKVVMADAIRFRSASASADSTPPAISEVTSLPRYDNATISWMTNEGATTQVEYGTTAEYGSQTTKELTYVTNHFAQISGLTPGTEYHFSVRSDDGGGNQSSSADLTFTTDSAPPSGSFRGCWLTSWGEGFHTESEVSSVIDTLDQSNYNALVFEARRNGDACFDSPYENKDPNISPQSFDPLADMITKAHARGIEVHAWIVTYRIADSTEANAPPIYWEHKNDWLTKDNTGATLGYGFYNLDQGVPGVQDYICKIVKDIVSRYDVDGISLDYIRYYGDSWGYNDITRERFRQEYGYYPPISGSEVGCHLWCDYRRQQVTDLVKKCYLEIMAIKPDVKLTVCGQTGTIWNYASSTAYVLYFQDWRQWMRDHIVDASMPMNYRTESDPAEAQAYRDCCDWSAGNRYGRHTYTLQSCYRNTITDTMTQLQYALDHGADGVNTFQYWATNNEGKTKEEFYSALKSTLFPSKVSVPDMPWKSAPTTGILFGTVKDTVKPADPIYQSWIYKATVTAEGPVTRTTITDATGTYGFLDLPPGTYSITVSKSGYASRTYPYQALTAGQVLRKDCDLGYAACLLPVSAKARQDDSRVELIAPVVSAVFADYFYVEASDRSSGIRVDKTDHGRTVGMRLDISGTVKTNSDGERYIEATDMLPDGSGSVEPLVMISRDLGGEDNLDPMTGAGQQGAEGAAGVNNIGLLVWTTGEVTYADPGGAYFYIDDGCGLTDVSGHVGVRVLPCGLAVPGQGTYVKVIGISSCFKDGDHLYRQIRATEIFPAD